MDQLQVSRTGLDPPGHELRVDRGHVEPRLLLGVAQLGAQAGPEVVRGGGVVAPGDHRGPSVGSGPSQQFGQHRGRGLVVGRRDLDPGQIGVGRVHVELHVPDRRGGAVVGEGHDPMMAAVVAGVVVEDGPQFCGAGDRQARVARPVDPLLEFQRRGEVR